MSTTFATPKSATRSGSGTKTGSGGRPKGSYTAARRAARKAASDRSVRRQLVRGRNLLHLSVLRRDQTSRWPFAITFGLVAAIAVVALLMLNTATAESSFTERKLSDELNALSLKEQSLTSDVAQQTSPQALAEKAGELGMVPGQNPGYLVIHPDGSVEWVEPKPPPAPQPTPEEVAAAQAADQAAAQAAADQAAADQAAADQAAADQAAQQQAAADQAAQQGDGAAPNPDQSAPGA